MSNLQEDIQRTVEDARADLRQRATRVGRNLRELASECPYAVVGGLDLALEKTRDVWRSATGVPGAVQRGVREAPDRLLGGIEDMGARGRTIVERVRGNDAVAEVGRHGRRARRSARATATSTRRAARAAGDAMRAGVEGIAEAGEAPEVDARPYEERTLEELYELAGERSVRGRSDMNKRELIAALRATR